jgi:hypothetical protein
VAKKSNIASSESKTAESAKKRQSAKPAIANESMTKRSVEKKPAASPTAANRTLAQDEIGSVAGMVWHTLSERGDQSVAALKKAVDAPGDLVMAAIGWLAREGKLNFDSGNRTLKISLR